MDFILSPRDTRARDAACPAERLAAASAFIPTTSYYVTKKADDVGRSVLQHPPLSKGEHAQASLAKVFDDPGMRPRVFSPAEVNKTSYGLMSRDIEGAVSVPKDIPSRPRDTNPNAPTYILPGSSSAAPSPASTVRSPPDHAVAAPAGGSSMRSASSSSYQQQHQLGGSGRDTLNVADIVAVPSVVERPKRLATRTTQLDTSDIEGSWPGWNPPFRAHVGKNLRDPGLDVRDISGPQGRSGRLRPQSAVPPAAAAAFALPVAPQPSSAPTTPRGARTDLPPGPPAMVTVGHPVVGKAVREDAPTRHSAQLAAAETRRHLQADAAAVVSALQPSPAAADALVAACRALDREGCGKLTAPELRAALAAAQLHVQLSPAEEVKLMRGVQDTAGFFDYTGLARDLQRKARGVPAPPPTLQSARRSGVADALIHHYNQQQQQQQGAQRQRAGSARPAAARDETAASSSCSANNSSTSARAAEPSTAWATPPSTEQQQQHQQQQQHSSHMTVPDGTQPRAAAAHPDLGAGAGAGSRCGHGHADASSTQQQAQPAATYYPYKASAYWFGGNDHVQGDPAAQEAAAYAPSHDPARTDPSVSQPPVGDIGGPLTASYYYYPMAGQANPASADVTSSSSSSSSRPPGWGGVAGGSGGFGASGSAKTTRSSRPASARAPSVAYNAYGTSTVSPYSAGHGKQQRQQHLSDSLLTALAGLSVSGGHKGPAAAAAQHHHAHAQGAQARPFSAHARLATKPVPAAAGWGLGAVPAAYQSGRAMGPARRERESLREEVQSVRALY